MFATCFVAVAVAAAPLDHTLATPWLELRGEAERITSLRWDPAGNRAYGPNWVKELVVDGLAATDNVRVERWARRIRVSGLRLRTNMAIHIWNHDHPVELQAGHTLGQSFTVDRGTFETLTLRTPTWHETGSAATLRLRRDGPAGELVAERRVTDMADNQWTDLHFAAQGSGTYYLEFADPQGMVGWWSTLKDEYSGGTAWVDGEPTPEIDRSLDVQVGEAVPAELVLNTNQTRLSVRLAWQPPEISAISPPELLLVTPWTKDGYDIGAASGAVFSRVYSDRQRLLPAEQFKRQTTNFGPGLDGSWVEFDGYANADLRVSAANVGYNWSAGPDRLVNHLAVPAEDHSQTWTFEGLPRDDALPADWPEFFSDDPQLDADLNRFFQERTFSYPGGGSTPWIAWSAVTGDWYAGPRRDAQRAAIAGLTIDDEGYVHTWGAARGWPFPDNNVWDTAHSDTNARYLLALWDYYAWTGDDEFLRSQAVRARLVMEYQLKQQRGAEGLIYAVSQDVDGRHRGIGNNYWDILPFGYLDAYVNAYFLASLDAMANIEAVLGDRPVPDYAGVAQRCRAAFDRVFWDEAAGRYIGCVDVDGQRHDYGFTFVNLEALALGQGAPDKARRIYDWLENGTTWEGKRDIYSRYVFAPRATTIHNPRWDANAPPRPAGAGEPWWMMGWTGTAWDEQCQDGGAILYTSYYDLHSRLRFFGAENAWQRFAAILERYREPDRLCGGPPLYRGENPQQLNPGAVGVDIPFPESGLVPCWFLDGALGVQPTATALEIQPALPRHLGRAGVRGLDWHGQRADITIERRGEGYRVTVRGEQNTVQTEIDSGATARFALDPKSHWLVHPASACP